MQYSNNKASGMERNSHIKVMLLTHDFYQTFLPAHKQIADAHHTSAVLNALEFPDKEAVDIFFNKAIAAGGKKTIETQDHGFMYGRDFEDLDGHIWEAFWMDMSQVPQQ
jgi:uncharacterized protein